MTATGVGAESITPLRPLSLAASIQQRAPLAVAIAVFAVAAWAATPYPVGIFHDDGVYLILAKALATGQGYRYLHLPGTPFATHYPPAYPALLALLWKIAPRFPANIALLLLMNAALLAFVAWAISRFAEQRLGWPRWAALVLALAGTLSAPLLLLSTLVMSEVLCLALLVPILAAGESALSDGEHRPIRLLSLGAASGAVVLVRAHALALPLAMLLLLAVRRRWSRAAWYALGAALVVLPWQVWVALHDSALAGPLHGSYGSYVGWFADGLAHGGIPFVWHAMMANGLEIASLVADRVGPWAPGWTRILPLLLTLATLGAGAVRLRRRAPLTLLFLAIYLAATLAWPYSPWRFLWAIWPFVLLVLGEGAWLAFERSPRTASAAWRAAMLASTAVLALGIVRAEVESYATRSWRVPVQIAQRQIAPLVRWVASRTSPDDVLLADDEPLVYLMTGRRALPPASFTALEYVRPAPATDSIGVRTLQALLARYRARYVLTVVPPTRDAARAIAAAPDSRPRLRELEPLGPSGAVFEVVR